MRFDNRTTREVFDGPLAWNRKTAMRDSIHSGSNSRAFSKSRDKSKTVRDSDGAFRFYNRIDNKAPFKDGTSEYKRYYEKRTN